MTMNTKTIFGQTAIYRSKATITKIVIESFLLQVKFSKELSNSFEKLLRILIEGEDEDERSNQVLQIVRTATII